MIFTSTIYFLTTAISNDTSFSFFFLFLSSPSITLVIPLFPPPVAAISPSNTGAMEKFEAIKEQRYTSTTRGRKLLLRLGVSATEIDDRTSRNPMAGLAPFSRTMSP